MLEVTVYTHQPWRGNNIILGGGLLENHSPHKGKINDPACFAHHKAERRRTLLLLLLPPGHFHAHRDFILHGHGQEGGRVDLEMGQRGRNRS
jgi:hypothetical protein